MNCAIQKNMDPGKENEAYELPPHPTPNQSGELMQKVDSGTLGAKPRKTLRQALMLESHDWLTGFDTKSNTYNRPIKVHKDTQSIRHES